MNGLSVAKNMWTSFCVSMDWATVMVNQHVLRAILFLVFINATTVLAGVCTADPALQISIVYFRYTGFW